MIPAGFVLIAEEERTRLVAIERAARAFVEANRAARLADKAFGVIGHETLLARRNGLVGEANDAYLELKGALLL